MAKKKPKKRNILKESKKAEDQQQPETAKTPDVETDVKPTVSKTIGKSRKTQSIEQKRQKDAEYQKDKRDREREEKEQKQEQESKELLLAIEVFACMPFDVLAKKDNKWTLSPQEREAFTGSAKALLDKYTETLISGYAVEASFLLCTCSILLPRMLFSNGKESQQTIRNPGEASNGENVSIKTDDRVQSARPGI